MRPRLRLPAAILSPSRLAVALAFVALGQMSALGGTVAGQEPPPDPPRSTYRMAAAYEASVRLDWDSRRVRVATTISVRNTSGGAVDQVHLNTVAARLGDLRLLRAEVDGAQVSARVSDQTITLPLPAELPDAGETVLWVVYRARLRIATTDRGYLWAQRGGVAHLHRFIPWLSRRTPFGPSTNGEPFVTPAAESVRVTLRADRPLVWAATGRRVSGPTTAADGSVSETFLAEDVRDFSVVASPRYRVLAGRSRDGRTRIVVYTLGEDARRWLALARRELHRLGRLVGRYPYDTYRVAEIGGPTAMEAPGLAWIPGGLSDAHDQYLIAHETAHQWFYAMVGNDQLTDAFADEAVADFLARHVLGRSRTSRCPLDRLDRSIHRYTRACYYETIYIQGGHFLDKLRRDYGDAGFWAALRAYADANRLEVASDRRLLEAFRDRFGDGVLGRYRVRFPSLYP